MEGMEVGKEFMEAEKEVVAARGLEDVVKVGPEDAGPVRVDAEMKEKKEPITKSKRQARGLSPARRIQDQREKCQVWNCRAEQDYHAPDEIPHTHYPDCSCAAQSTKASFLKTGPPKSSPTSKPPGSSTSKPPSLTGKVKSIKTGLRALSMNGSPLVRTYPLSPEPTPSTPPSPRSGSPLIAPEPDAGRAKSVEAIPKVIEKAPTPQPSNSSPIATRPALPPSSPPRPPTPLALSPPKASAPSADAGDNDIDAALWATEYDHISSNIVEASLCERLMTLGRERLAKRAEIVAEKPSPTSRVRVKEIKPPPNQHAPTYSVLATSQIPKGALVLEYRYALSDAHAYMLNKAHQYALLGTGTKVRYKPFFYPIGNTAAISLTQDLSPEQPADILLLGCGDPRNILFTLYADVVVLSARNILLFTLLEENELVERASKILTRQSRRLYDTASSIEAWRKSPYGSFLKFVDARTLADVRRRRKSYADFPSISPSRLSKLRQEQSRLSKSVLAEHHSNISPSRSAGVLWVEAAVPIIELFKRYWETGTTFMLNADIKRAKDLNPTFVYSAPGEVFDPHYGTVPQGFHLTPAFVPVTPGATDPNAAKPEAAIVDVMQQQFKAWGNAFRASRAAGTITLRFYSGEAIAFCRALDGFASTGRAATGIRVSSWRAPQINLAELHVSTPSAPISFDVIGTSNLTDHLGLLITRHQAIGLCEPNNGGIYAILLVGGLRLDLASFTVIVDTALVPLSTERMSSLTPSIQKLQDESPVVQVITEAHKAVAWKKLLPAYVERCRTRKHKAKCGYAAQGEILLSLKMDESPICTCGEGLRFGGPEWRVEPWEGLFPFATRAAISPLFSVSYVESVAGMAGLRVPAWGFMRIFFLLCIVILVYRTWIR
ncbi:hypothetical protein FRC06_003876 [Ceratobasidium sp. 370]|nr:hypothetical protein FRC06_003876 [Ceratobasidium sp. 370]